MTRSTPATPERPLSKLEQRVVTAAEAALARSKSVSLIDVLAGMNWLTAAAVDDWRRGRIDYLLRAVSATADKQATVLKCFVDWARDKGLQPSETAYVSATRDRRPLRFATSADEAAQDPEAAENAERICRTHWISPELSPARREQLTARQNKAPDLVVIEPIHDWTCSSCGESGGLLIMEDAGPLCLTCTDMDHLVFLPSGDAALTRRAKKESTLSAVVVRWSRRRKRYERRGLLVEEPALERAEEQCLADEDLRARRRERDQERRELQDLEFQARVAKEILRLFPRCPAGRAEAIAAHTGTRGSGRVGRTAAGRALDEGAVTLAVIASIRHEDTDYDELLMSGVPREDARARIRPAVDTVLDSWRSIS